ncbi:MAG: MBL fold metallo-hydrolase [Patescibacteria group bacterium]|nr:MBL fold metallo-hydrolase [Patescibacteria group bacterium]
MHILWYGLSSFKIISRDITIFTDPFGKSAGLTPPRGGGQIVVSSNPDSDLANNFSGITDSPFIIQSAGEYDVKGIFIRGIPVVFGKQPEGKSVLDRRTVFTISAEGVTLGFLGMFGEKSLDQVQIEELDNVDVLLVPVGGSPVASAETAIAIVNEVEPKVVIPMFYKTPGLGLKLESLERFAKEMGGKGEEMDKLLIKKNDLNEEKTRFVILTPQRS